MNQQGSAEALESPSLTSPPATVSNNFFSFLTQNINVTQLAANIESKASELVEIGRRSGLVDKANELVELTKENALELAKQANDLKESYSKYHASDVPTSIAVSDKTLDLTYITENIIAMAFPYDLTKVKVNDGNDIRAVAKFLEEKHFEHYMIWNISEEAYDATAFHDQVLDYKFPGHPAPPLGLLFKICTSMESWLDADPLNVAVVHCYTGKGRTSALLACVLCWIGEFASPALALEYISERKGISVDTLTIPSQRRYVQYFSNMIDGVKPRSEPLLLRRVIMNTIPIFGNNNIAQDSVGCKPYIQLFKNGKLIATAASQKSSIGDETVLQWVDVKEGSVAFSIDCPVQGDILLRCRHADDEKRVSMFRAAFHTGYVPLGVLRLTKEQLDGPSVDTRFHEDFFIDLIFAPVVENSESIASTFPSDKGITLDKSAADACEEFMHRDVRFWESIAARKARSRRRTARQFATSSQEKFSISDDAPLPAVASPTLETRSTSGFSNTDLILELSRAETDSVFATPASKPAAGAAVTSAVKIPSELAFLDDLDFMTPTAAKTSRPSTELSALEELEKELGLKEYVIPTPDDSGKKKIVQLQSAVEDDIDELEKYLNSLNTSTPSK